MSRQGLRSRLTSSILVIAALLLGGAAPVSLPALPTPELLAVSDSQFSRPLRVEVEVSPTLTDLAAPPSGPPGGAESLQPQLLPRSASDSIEPLPEPALSRDAAVGDESDSIESSPAESITFPPVGAAPSARFAPVWIGIPRIGVDTQIVPVGVTPEGQLGVPPDYVSVGWYQFGPAPGEQGKAVLSGHLDSRTGPAVFFRLGELSAGDEIIIRSGGAGQEMVFTVTETALHWLDEVPLDQVYGTSDNPEIVLITCGGPFDKGAGNYLQRWIIRAEIRQN